MTQDLTPPLDAGGLDQEVLRTNFAWLLRLRWGAIAGQVATILTVQMWMHIGLPVLPLGVIIGIEFVTNVAAEVWIRRRAEVREAALALLLALDVLLLTALLYFTGGPFNPFSFLYLVHIALAAVVLRTGFSWGLVALSFAGFGSLFLNHVGLASGWLEHPDQHALHLAMHMQGMWIAFGIAAVFIVYFVTRVTRDLARREAELGRARSAALRSEKLASLATLAAGAAHELATPLSTIAVVARELERELERAGTLGDAVTDARLIRQEVGRCRTILEQLAADAGQSSGESFSALSVHGLIEQATDGVSRRERVSSTIAADAERLQLYVPPRSVAQALRGVIENALQASPPDAGVTVRVSRAGEQCAITVEDSGSGMPPEIKARAGEPFFTTKEPGKGMGLGLFLTRALVERLGGAIEIDSAPGRGTRVMLRVPLAAHGALAQAPALAAPRGSA